MKRDSFATYHPLVNFAYFVIMLVFSMVFMHPIMQGIALLSAALYAASMTGRKAAAFQLRFLIPLLLVMAVFNPLFNHAGVTILFYLNNGNPITLESLVYGAASACMFVTVIIWFSCYNAVMTSDKFIYLFGKLMPALSLILSMVLRFVPRYIVQIKLISNAQRCIGRDITQGSVLEQARNGLRILSIMTTWALENAIETADSMKSRGYGLPNRTSFALFRMARRDVSLLLIMSLLVIIVAAGAGMGENTMRYFPSIKLNEITVYSVIVYLAYLMLCMIPVILNRLEAIKWKSIESKM